MEFADLPVSIKEGKGKEISKRLRDKGFVPAVVYKRGEDTVSLKVESRALLKAIHTGARGNVILRLHIDDVNERKERTVIIKDIQRDPVKDTLLHVDFQEISLIEALKVKIPIVSKGEAIGVKSEGGVLNQLLWEIEVECLPTNIPEKIEVNISKLKIGDSIYIKDIQPPEGVKVLEDTESIIFSVEHTKVIEEAVTAPIEGETQEPEVIKEKKEKEVVEEEDEAKEKKP